MTFCRINPPAIEQENDEEKKKNENVFKATMMMNKAIEQIHETHFLFV